LTLRCRHARTTGICSVRRDDHALSPGLAGPRFSPGGLPLANGSKVL
jgi:hypothetical protein